MLAAQPPHSHSGHRHQQRHHPIQVPNSSRRPLQSKNQSITTSNLKPNPDPAEWIDISRLDNKENIPPSYSTPGKKQSPPIEPLDASLADELIAIREKLERLKIDKMKTEKMLRERILTLDLQMTEILNRGEVQTQLEIEVDRLYRLKEIRIACLRTSQLRSLRDKEHEKKMKQDQQTGSTKTEDMDEQGGEVPPRTPNPYN